jgi:hypothetical protein
MRRLLSPIGHRHLPSAGGARLSPYLLPPPFFSFSLLCPVVGLGRCRSSAPARLFRFLEVK